MSAEKPFKNLLDREIHFFLNLKRLAELQIRTFKTCSAKTIKNDLLYEQFLFASIDGLFTRLHNFGERLIGFLAVVKGGHLYNLKRNNRRGLAVAPREVNVVSGPDERLARSVARDITEELQQKFLERYDARFPGVSARSAGAPNHKDIDAVVDKLRKVLEPIKRHRDKVVAHWDDQAEPATVTDLEHALAHIEALLGDLFLFSQLGSYVFELGGIAADVKGTAIDLCELILGEFRVRAAATKEMKDIYMMGFDTWGAGQSEEQYVANCRASAKYAAGKWYVLEDRDGHPVSSVIVYEKPAYGQAQPAVGIGSLATKSSERRRGHGRQLIWDLMRQLQGPQSATVFYLYADANPAFYEELGFVRLPERLQTKPGSTAMIRGRDEVLRTMLEDSSYFPPAYFPPAYF